MNVVILCVFCEPPLQVGSFWYCMSLPISPFIRVDTNSDAPLHFSSSFFSLLIFFNFLIPYFGLHVLAYRSIYQGGHKLWCPFTCSHHCQHHHHFIFVFNIKHLFLGTNTHIVVSCLKIVLLFLKRAFFYFFFNSIFRLFWKYLDTRSLGAPPGPNF